AGRISHGEVVTHAGAADDHAIDESPALQIENVVVGWNFRIPREVIARGIQSVDAVLRAIIDHIRQGKRAVAQRLVKRVRVEPEFDADSAGAAHASLREGGSGGDRNRGEAEGPAQETAALN